MITTDDARVIIRRTDALIEEIREPGFMATNADLTVALNDVLFCVEEVAQLNLRMEKMQELIDLQKELVGKLEETIVELTAQRDEAIASNEDLFRFAEKVVG